MDVRKAVLLAFTHGLVAAGGFGAGIYALPILIAPPAPTAAQVASAATQAAWTGTFRRDLADSDALHWGEGTVTISPNAIALSGRLAPGPDYKLYLSPAFVETEEAFHRLKPRMVRVGDVKTFEKPNFPKGEISGFGFHEAPRGMLSHWIVIENGIIKNYQAVVPTTWNAAPRNEQDQMGPYESSLVDTPLADPERPLEVLRTIHSFDPCLACAVHLTDTSQRTIAQVKVL